MIYYQGGSLCVSLSSVATVRAAMLQRTVRTGAVLGILVGVLASLLKYADGQHEFLQFIMPDTMVYGAFTSAVGFLLVFRVSQSYLRFTEGASLMHVMESDFLDTAGLMMAMSRASSASQSKVLDFRRVVVRLVSCLNMLCLCELGGVEVTDLSSLRTKCIDLEGLDETTLRLIGASQCKADVAAQLLQNIMTDSLKHVFLDVPPPLLTRIYQELGGGMIRFHEALKLRNVPCPFPIMVVSELVLIAHALYTPLQMSFVNQGPIGAALFSATFVFFSWTLYSLAAEFDDPFGTDPNDLDLKHLQEHLNHRLLSLLALSVAPVTTLGDRAADETQMLFDLGTKEVNFEIEKKESVKIRMNHTVSCDMVAAQSGGSNFLVRVGKSFTAEHSNPKPPEHDPLPDSEALGASPAESRGAAPSSENDDAEKPGFQWISFRQERPDELHMDAPTFDCEQLHLWDTEQQPSIRVATAPYARVSLDRLDCEF